MIVALILIIVVVGLYYGNMLLQDEVEDTSSQSSSQSSTLSSNMSGSLFSSDAESSNNSIESNIESLLDSDNEYRKDDDIDTHRPSSTTALTSKPSGGGNTTTASKAAPSKAMSSTAPASSETMLPASSAPPDLPVESSETPEPLMVNINTATKEELMQLTGIGIGTAHDIVFYREEIGGYTSIEQLMEVYGIGQRMFDRIKDNICV